VAGGRLSPSTADGVIDGSLTTPPIRTDAR